MKILPHVQMVALVMVGAGLVGWVAGQLVRVFMLP